MKTLTIRLTSPLQSYGNEASFDRRTSGDCPSKSAIIGMIAAALGYRRDNPRILKLNDLSFAVRVDQWGKTLTDFHIVEWKQGKPPTLTYRDYLQDAIFVVGIGHENEELIDNIQKALRQPKFQLFLGRRANVPAGLLNLKLFTNTDPITVLEKLKWQASKWYQEKMWQQNKKKFVNHIEIIADANLLPNKRVVMVKDRVKSFSQKNRQYSYRSVAFEEIKLKNPCAEQTQATVDLKNTDHDPMQFL
jgi:CRISPR system Cascade subunit CasD